MLLWVVLIGKRRARDVAARNFQNSAPCSRATISACSKQARIQGAYPGEQELVGAVGENV
ncbi:hypothetical protein [Bradyrhizobium sp.]|uniref:hypothetical protein n=1 Tax=Bradyrhizobium sp. TaxID=376 RepID=UPI003C49C6E9